MIRDLDDAILNITAGLVLDEVKHSRVLSEDVLIDQSNLNEEFQNQPLLFSWWGTMTELARDIVNRKKTALRKLHAVIDHRAREENQRLRIDAKDKKVDVPRLTETMVENIVITSPEYVALEKELLESQKNLSLLQVGRDAMIMRKEMLISLGANFRAEGTADPAIMKEAAKARARAMQDRKETSTKIKNNGNSSEEQPVVRPVRRK